MNTSTSIPTNYMKRVRSASTVNIWFSKFIEAKLIVLYFA